MKVLMVISQFFPVVGGAEKQAQLLARELIKKGHQVRVVTGWWNFRTPRKEVVDEIEVDRNFSCLGMFGVRGNRPLGGLTYMASLGIYLLTRGWEYDIIHVHQALYPAFVSVLVGKQILGKPVIVKTASSGITSDIRQLKKIPLGRFQLEYLLKRMDCLVAVSEAGANEYRAIGFPETRIANIPNGVAIPDDENEVNRDVRCVMTTARLSHEKGIDVLLRAWADVVQQEKDLRLVILGDGPLKADLKNLCQSLNIDGSVQFAGRVEGVSDYLKTADLFVLPSRTEGLSNALLEASSRGLPCIATTVGGNRELFESEAKEIPSGEYLLAKNGVLVNAGDVTGLSMAMVDVIRNRTVREAVGRNARKAVQENYSIDTVAERYLALYRSLLKENT